MKVLLAPMAAVAETNGPFSRTKKIAQECLNRGHDVALCAAKDINYQSIEGVDNYYAPIPSPFGLPLFLGKRVYKFVQMLGIQNKKQVRSFEEVLHISGAISKKNFKDDVNSIIKAINKFKPDIIYSEVRIAAIVAAILENKKVITSYSYPIQKTYACNPEYSKYVKRFLRENELPQIESVLDIFNWSQLKIVPSIYELEPIKDKNVLFAGTFNYYQNHINHINKRNKILVYMGTGSISPKRQVKEMREAFLDSEYEVYIATKQLNGFKENNINVAERYDFSKLLPESIAYINHGGQNSIIDGMVYGVPQIIIPGKVFERRYNAKSVEKNGAGKILTEKEFKSYNIKNIIKEFKKDNTYCISAKHMGKKLEEQGGVKKVVDAIEKLYNDGYLT